MTTKNKNVRVVGGLHKTKTHEWVGVISFEGGRKVWQKLRRLLNGEGVYFRQHQTKQPEAIK